MGHHLGRPHLDGGMVSPFFFFWSPMIPSLAVSTFILLCDEAYTDFFLFDGSAFSKEHLTTSLPSSQAGEFRVASPSPSVSIPRLTFSSSPSLAESSPESASECRLLSSLCTRLRSRLPELEEGSFLCNSGRCELSRCLSSFLSLENGP